MTETFQTLLAVTLIVFMVGSLLEVGLRLDLREAAVALRNTRFVLHTVLWAFVLCPALAVLLTRLVPLAEPYAIGLLLLGMAPCAPFLPVVSERARGDLAYVAAFMLLSAVGTVAFMPLLVPVLVTGLSAGPWTIAKPLLFYIAAPLAAGIVVRRVSCPWAERAHPTVKRVTAIDTLLMVGLVLVLYGKDIVSAIGSYAIVTQLLFYVLVATGAHRLGVGLTAGQRSVLALGACTRNLGAAFAPLVAVAGVDRRAIAMVAMAVPLSVLCAFVAASAFARRSAAGDPARA